MFSEAFAISPHDTNDLAKATTSLYVGTAGHVAVIMAKDTSLTPTTVVFNAVPAGTILPIKVRRVLATGTTATLLVGLKQ